MSEDAPPALLSPRQFGWDIDPDAPGYFPENLKSAPGLIEPDDHDLIATQKAIVADHPALTSFKARKARPVDIVVMNGDRYINDGHHTLAGAQRAGKTVKARFWYDPDAE